MELQHRYSDNVTNNTIAIIGPTPPPLGGISVHVERVVAKLIQQHNTVRTFDVTHANRYWFLWYRLKMLYFLCTLRPSIVYYHIIYLRCTVPDLYVLLLLKRLLKFELITVDHDCRYMYSISKPIKKRLRKLMPRVDQQIFIGDITFKSHNDNNIPHAANYAVESAFLPPDLTRQDTLLQNYPVSLFMFFKTHKPIVTVNAFQLSLLNGKDLYGIDLCIELLDRIINTNPQTGLLIVLGNIGNQMHYNHLVQRATALNITENVYWLVGQKELWPLFKYTDLFVRPTLSDGASVSLAEALHCGITSVASNVCQRPSGTVLFQAGDVDDLYQKVFETLAKEQTKNAAQDSLSQPTSENA